ncbi:MAG: asparaginase [Corynebacterium sp.]|nr:asparaginase [Corynebacterium sp.]
MIVVLATGGTIACTTAPDGSLVPTIEAADLVAALHKHAPTTGETGLLAVDSARLDSSSLTLQQLDALVAQVRALLADDSVEAIIITHGTDSMEDTAMALLLLLQPEKPVILTGAQRSFDHAESDGIANLADSLEFIISGSYSSGGVWIRFGGATIPAWGAQKIHTSNLLAFAADLDAIMPELPPRITAPLADTNVAVVAAWPGASRAVIDAVAQLSDHAAIDGLVIEAMGSGNLSTEMGEALCELAQAGLPVVITTRVSAGPVSFTYGGKGGGSSLGKAGAHAAGYLRSGQARMLLTIDIATGQYPTLVNLADQQAKAAGRLRQRT